MSDPPSITDWISASATGVAALGTVGALWVGVVTFMRQVKDQRRAQAAGVTIWVAHGLLGAPDGRMDRSQANVFNADAIFDVTIECFDRDGRSILDPAHFDVVPAGHGASGPPFAPQIGLSTALVRFKDGADRQWIRYSDGRLVELGRVRGRRTRD